jgi:3-oxoacyl-[acyl-carrier-protein] synthase II
MARRVVITGVGVVSALGVGREAYFQGLREKTVGIKRITRFDPSGFASQVGGEAPAVAMSQVVPKSHRKATKLMSRDIELAVIAADAAVRDARLNTKGTNPDTPPDFDPTRAGTNIGAGLICCDLVELGSAAAAAVTDGQFDYHKWGKEGMEQLTPLWLLKYLPNMLGCHVSIIHDLQGPNNNITCAEASGLLAVGEAYRTIVCGKADLMVAGGAECKVNPMAIVRQSLLGRASTRYNDRPAEASRPFDRDADGIVVGEGAGIVILEEMEHARRRGATIYAEVKGFGASCNYSPDFMTPAPQAEGITLALRKALSEANVTAADVDLLVAHGLAVPGLDRAEATAIRETFGDHSKKLPVYVTKSRVGNCGAGSSGIDLATAVLSLAENTVPPMVNCPHVPAEYGLRIEPEGVSSKIRHAAVSCYTFGGQTAALLLSHAG